MFADESGKIELMPKKSGFTRTNFVEQNLRGFTLIELLITIAIIAILSAIGLVAYSTVLKQGRDAKRQSDLRSIQSALEQYNSDQGFYPVSTGLTFGSALSGGGKTYMNTVPTGSPQYNYTASASTTSFVACDNSSTKCIGYCLYADMDNSAILAPTGCTYTGTAYDFAVTPP